jgi:hypothetical protein
MFNANATISTALDNTDITDNDVLIHAAHRSMCWHDPIAVELNRRTAEPLLKQLSDQDLQALLDTDDVSTVINNTILQHLS